MGKKMMEPKRGEDSLACCRWSEEERQERGGGDDVRVVLNFNAR